MKTVSRMETEGVDTIKDNSIFVVQKTMKVVIYFET